MGDPYTTLGNTRAPPPHTRHTSNTLGTLLVPPQCISVHSSIPCGPQYSFTALQYTFEAHPMLPGYLKDPPCSLYNASRDPRSPLHSPVTFPHTNRRCSCPLRQHRRSCGAWSPWATTGCSCRARGWSRPPCPSRPPSTPVSWACGSLEGGVLGPGGSPGTWMPYRWTHLGPLTPWVEGSGGIQIPGCFGCGVGGEHLEPESLDRGAPRFLVSWVGSGHLGA